MFRLITVAALMALAGLAFACGEQEVEPQTSDTPTASPPPATADVTPAPDATQTPVPTPPVGGKAPDGCLPTELAYVDPAGRFAFCYAPNMKIDTADTKEGPAVTAQYPPGDPNYVSVTIGHLTEPYALCSESILDVKTRNIGTYSIDGTEVEACFQDHYDPAQPSVLLFKTIEFRAPLASGKFVQVLATYSGGDSMRDGVPVADIATRILESSVIY